MRRLEGQAAEVVMDLMTDAFLVIVRAGDGRPRVTPPATAPAVRR